jgi:hypothetical protein
MKAPRRRLQRPGAGTGGISSHARQPKGTKPAAKAGKAKSKASGPKAKSSPKAPKAHERLRPGQLDGLVLSYMKKHKGELPVGPTTVARGIKRSSGAVGNCLGRLEQAEKVRMVGKKPRRYDLAGSTKR